MNIKSIVLGCIVVASIALFISDGESLYDSPTSETTESAIVDSSFVIPLTLITHTDHTECVDSTGDTLTCKSAGEDGEYVINPIFHIQAMLQFLTTPRS